MNLILENVSVFLSGMAVGMAVANVILLFPGRKRK